MRFVTVIFFCVLFNFIGYKVCAQEQKENNEDDNELFELCLEPCALQSIDEHNTTLGFDGFILKQISKKFPVIVGFGLDLDKNSSIGPVLGYSPFEGLDFLVSPMISKAKGEIEYSTHTEVSYEFKINNYFQIGPSVGYAFSKAESQISMGLCIDFEFHR
ncbi:MAG TPA: hypothetical protein VIH57_06790 [Bacteroidales bacterium]